MLKTILLSLVMLLSAAWMLAQQDSSQQPSSAQTSSASSSTGNQTTVEGCLSGANGNYSLVDKSGTRYQLTGDVAQLEQHVGHTVQITGTSAMASASTTQPGTMSSPSQQNTINVTSLKHISATCNPKQ